MFLHGEQVFTCSVWEAREELSDGNSTNDVLLEGIHGLVVSYAGKEARVPINQVVTL